MDRFDRRKFLKKTVSMTAGLVLGGAFNYEVIAEPKSLVVQVRSKRWCRSNGKVNAEIIKRMIDKGMMRLTNKKTPEAAWRSLFSPKEVVGIKFNRISRDFTGANQALVDAIVSGLTSVGIPRRNIIVVEAIGVRFDGGKPKDGWAKRVDFGSGKTRLSNFIVNQIDALINVPNIKQHPLAGFTGALKNISHAGGTIMEGPNRFHTNSCDPYIADIYAVKEIREKIRFHISNGLKGIFDRGAEPPPPQFQWFLNSIFLSFDPVALDTIGAELVDRARSQHRGEELRRDPRALKYLKTAAGRGLGVNDPRRIALVKLTV
ncbi:DUF362 domain-containing protein [Candidatus Poribacteria bacterium]|nr:DUF362 domain-containing protein [Candidatus Poribacteria bacterium]